MQQPRGVCGDLKDTMQHSTEVCHARETLISELDRAGHTISIEVCGVRESVQYVSKDCVFLLEATLHRGLLNNLLCFADQRFVHIYSGKMVFLFHIFL